MEVTQADKALACCSTHCERSQECRSPHDCASSKKSWGDVFRQHVAAGEDHASAAFAADKWQERKARRQP